jgi:hypothetical protein
VSAFGHITRATSLKTASGARRLRHVSKTRTLRWVVTLAFFLNVLGSPMAWAQVFDSPVDHGNATQMAPSCHGEGAASTGDTPAPESPPCCDGGSCTCAASALSVYFATDASRMPHPPFSARHEPAALPAHPLDDTLRPPIR